MAQLEDLRQRHSGAAMPTDTADTRLHHLVELMQSRMPVGQQLDNALAVQRKAVSTCEQFEKQELALLDQLALLATRLQEAVQAEHREAAETPSPSAAPAPSAALEQAQAAILSALATHSVDATTTAAVQTLLSIFRALEHPHCHPCSYRAPHRWSSEWGWQCHPSGHGSSAGAAVDPQALAPPRLLRLSARSHILLLILTAHGMSSNIRVCPILSTVRLLVQDLDLVQLTTFVYMHARPCSGSMLGVADYVV
eukprot:3685957-Amphidinium_carterae.3